MKDNRVVSNPFQANDSSTQFLYGTLPGRLVLRLMLFLRVPALLGLLLRSSLSRFYIKSFIKKNGIDMTGFEDTRFRSFNDFFTRKKDICYDAEVNHLIAPSDSLLSVYPLMADERFHVKGFDYSLEDFFETERFGFSNTEGKEIISQFEGGLCLIFRLCASDYHRYCYIDMGCHAGEAGKNHFIPGSLYSVQPLAAEHFRIYTKNRRSWTILKTEHFGNVAQIEIGAFSVGGIVNHKPLSKPTGLAFCKGDEKGYFDLHGSTIVLLFQKDRVQLLPELAEATAGGKEYRVRIGQCIGKGL